MFLRQWWGKFLWQINLSSSRYNAGKYFFLSLSRIIHPDKDCILFSNRISFQTFETFVWIYKNDHSNNWSFFYSKFENKNCSLRFSHYSHYYLIHNFLHKFGQSFQTFFSKIVNRSLSYFQIFTNNLKKIRIE